MLLSIFQSMLCQTFMPSKNPIFNVVCHFYAVFSRGVFNSFWLFFSFMWSREGVKPLFSPIKMDTKWYFFSKYPKTDEFLSEKSVIFKNYDRNFYLQIVNSEFIKVLHLIFKKSKKTSEIGIHFCQNRMLMPLLCRMLYAFYICHQLCNVYR